MIDFFDYMNSAGVPQTWGTLRLVSLAPRAQTLLRSGAGD